jgi:uncharacterized lipoprotein YddW (UPF0748 family)
MAVSETMKQAIRTAAALLSLSVALSSSRASAQPVEARALWVTRFDYDSEAKIARIMETAARANFNIIYFQARAAADAFYRSDIEPCAVLLCGHMGGTPPYDPLEVAVREGHRRGLQVHAYLNALTAQPARISGVCNVIHESDPGQPRHMLLDHPDWVMTDRRGRRLPCPNREEYLWLSPGFAGVRTRLAHVAADIARRYDVDGIHLDRIRYPGPEWSYDPASLAEFGREPSLFPAEWRAFRTDLVNRMVKETHDSVAAIKPMLPISAAVWGVYDDNWHWRTVRGSKDLMQDARAWARDGYLDVIVPMTYYSIERVECSRADWSCLLSEHVAGSAATGKQMYIGIAAKKGAAEVVSQIRLARERGATGIAMFSYSTAAEKNVWGVLAATVFSEKAQVPAMPWKSVSASAGTSGAAQR